MKDNEDFDRDFEYSDGFSKSFSRWFALILILLLFSIIIGWQLFSYYTRDLPDYTQLENYNPPTITRIYSSDMKLIAEYAKQKRILVNYEEMPKLVVNAFLAAEDKNFFSHQGIDFISIARALFQNVFNITKNKRAVGGSTITQQVIKEFLVGNERTLSRKVKEAVLAYRITNTYSKQRILELYLNQIFLGHGSYGIAAAADVYFRKELSELLPEEAALLAALPKAPSYLNPYSHYERAKARRDWVLSRMKEEGFITDLDYQNSIKKPINVKKISLNRFRTANTFYSEAVRQELISILGEKAFYEGGLIVNTYLDIKLQKLAEEDFKKGILAYDKKYGFRGALSKIKIIDSWKDELLKLKKTFINKDFDIAVVTGFNSKITQIAFSDGSGGKINFEALSWAKKAFPNKRYSNAPKSPKDVLNIGDVIYVKQIEGNLYSLEQRPDVNGAMVVMEPVTGKVFALIGGYDANKSDFNRAIQAERQLGSAFKTFMYLAALESGFLPNSIILDEKISISQGKGMPMWTPKNFKGDFMGPITLRTALEQSRNLPTVRLMMALGMKKITNLTRRLNLFSQDPKNYSVSLGAHESTLIKTTNAYNIIASNGMQTKPHLIDSVYDNKGRLIYRNEDVLYSNFDSDSALPGVDLKSMRVIDQNVNYQILSILEGSVKRGMSRNANVEGRAIAGKTGTTNHSFDAWFIGFSPELTAGIYVGYDSPKTLGEKETGATISAPIFKSFMTSVLKDRNVQFAPPDTVDFVYVDKYSGKILQNQDNIPSTAILEVFPKLGTDTKQNFDKLGEKSEQQQAQEKEDSSNNTLDDIFNSISSEGSETDEKSDRDRKDKFEEFY